MNGAQPIVMQLTCYWLQLNQCHVTLRRLECVEDPILHGRHNYMTVFSLLITWSRLSHRLQFIPTHVHESQDIVLQVSILLGYYSSKLLSLT